MPETFTCKRVENIIVPFGIDYGAPLEIIRQIDPYFLIRRRGFMAWSGNFMPRHYISAEYMILLLTPEDDNKFNAKVILQKECDKSTSYRKIMEELRQTMTDLAAGYKGKDADEWIIYEILSENFSYGHVTYIDIFNAAHLDKIKDIDGTEKEVNVAVHPNRVWVRNADFKTYIEIYQQAKMIKANWATISTSIIAHRRELDRQWYAGQDEEKANLEALKKKFKTAP